VNVSVTVELIPTTALHRLAINFATRPSWLQSTFSHTRESDVPRVAAAAAIAARAPLA
jgi:hypothetical protein